jgi:hypothetical protein
VSRLDGAGDWPVCRDKFPSHPATGWWDPEQFGIDSCEQGLTLRGVWG